MDKNSQVNILGTRGIPAAHGGFETFAERLAKYLVGQGWAVTVYCQADKPSRNGQRQWDDRWCGIDRRFIAPRRPGVIGTIEFDFHAVRHVLHQPGVDLILGYNTALFNLAQSLKRRPMAINMDGIEWQRDKWSLPTKFWFLVNEIIGSNLCGTPIADHPQIAAHLKRLSFKTPAVIAYGSDRIAGTAKSALAEWGLEPDRYFISVARIEPENSILELVEAFALSNIDLSYLILGQMDPNNVYHRAVQKAANGRTIFAGAIYDSERLSALRYHARGHLHGHKVGGTNPSLVEALGAGNPVIAHDNKFNRWTAGPGQFYFGDIETCAAIMTALALDDKIVEEARRASRLRHGQAFQWATVLSAYEHLLASILVKN